MKRLLLVVGAMTVLASCASDQSDNVTITPHEPWESPAEAPDGVIKAVPMPSSALDMSRTLTRIVFASCAQQNEDQAIWDVIAAENPDLTLYIGDNVYGDVRSDDAALPELKAAYMRLAQSEPFARARAAAPMLTTWDDHDFGLNDGGGDYQHKENAEALFEYVWDVKDARATRPGVYGSWMLGEEAGRRVQIIMLDTRYFRSPLKPTDEYGVKGKERYVPDPAPQKTMLGEAQWRWLGEQLSKSADLRLLVSSVQVISEGHGWEAWKMLPAERARLYKMIEETGASGVVLLTGDRHAAALYQQDGVIGYPLYEATSSSLNLPLRAWLNPDEPYIQEPGPNRLTDMIIDANYGLLEIDWEVGVVEISIRGTDGEEIATKLVELEALR